MPLRPKKQARRGRPLEVDVAQAPEVGFAQAIGNAADVSKARVKLL